MVEKSRTKPKVKSVHTVHVMEETPHIEVRTEARDKSMDLVYRIDNCLVKSGKCWNANFKYPCPVDSHNHELYQCGVFQGMTPQGGAREAQGEDL